MVVTVPGSSGTPALWPPGTGDQGASLCGLSTPTDFTQLESVGAGLAEQ